MGRIVVSLKDMFPEPVNVRGIGVFAGVVRLKISRWTLNPMTGVLVRDREKPRARREAGRAEMEAGIGEMQPQRNVNSHQKVAEARSRSSLRRECSPADTSRIVRK